MRHLIINGFVFKKSDELVSNIFRQNCIDEIDIYPFMSKPKFFLLQMLEILGGLSEFL